MNKASKSFVCRGCTHQVPVWILVMVQVWSQWISSVTVLTGTPS